MENKEKLGQEPAFPIVQQKYDSISSNFVMGVSDIGISKRFYAVCAAMQGLVQRNGISNMPSAKENNIKILITDAYNIADELLKQENE